MMPKKPLSRWKKRLLKYRRNHVFLKVMRGDFGGRILRTRFLFWHNNINIELQQTLWPHLFRLSHCVIHNFYRVILANPIFAFCFCFFFLRNCDISFIKSIYVQIKLFLKKFQIFCPKLLLHKNVDQLGISSEMSSTGIVHFYVIKFSTCTCL